MCMKVKDIALLEKKLDYVFKNRELLREALTHKSLRKPYNNERLEFLGDAVLDLVVAEFLYNKFFQKNEGILSKMRASLVNEKSFYKLAMSIHLGDYINLSISEDNNGGRLKASLLSDAFEAIMAVIYIESGLNEVKRVFYPIMLGEFDIDENTLLRDYKSRLQEYTQEKFGCIPIYELLLQKGPDHKKSFTMQVKIGDNIYAIGEGASKKIAQQEAARITLEILENK